MAKTKCAGREVEMVTGDGLGGRRNYMARLAKRAGDGGGTRSRNGHRGRLGRQAELCGDVGEAFEVEDGMAGHFHSVTGLFDGEVSAASGDLAGGHFRFFESRGPVGR